jgi:PilZ domain
MATTGTRFLDDSKPKSSGTAIQSSEPRVSPIADSRDHSGRGARLGSSEARQRGKNATAERRRQKRARVRLMARVCPAELSVESGSEVAATVNASCYSLYFVSVRDCYRVGMRVRVAFPYDAANPGAVYMEDWGEVTRIDELPNRRVGVALHLQRAEPAARGGDDWISGRDWVWKPFGSRGATAERRLTSRRLFSADALVVDEQAAIRLQARCSDLSLQGCYVDTMNPLPVGTLACLELRVKDEVFRTIAQVSSSHAGMGMGLRFEEPSPDQIAVLAGWLGLQPGVQLRSEPRAGVTEQNDDLERTLAKGAVRDMVQKGSLTKADLSEILFDPGRS